MTAAQSTPAAPSAAPIPVSAPPARRSLKKNIVYAVIGMGIFNLCQAGVMVLLAKFASPEIVGAFNYGAALSSPYVLFFALQLRGVLISDVSGEFTYGTYQTLRTLGAVASAIVIAGLLLWEARTTPGLSILVIITGVCAGKIVWSFAELCWGLFQKRERIDLLAYSNILRGFGLLLPFALTVPLYYYLTTRGHLPANRLAEGTAWACALNAALWMLIYLLYDRPRVTRQADYDARWTWNAVWKLTLRALPLGFVMLIINLCDSVPRWEIAKHHAGAKGLADLGYYSAITYVTLVANLLIIQAGQAAANRLSLYYQTNLPAFLWLLGKLIVLAVGMGLVLVLGAWLFGKWLLAVLYTTDYARYYKEFLVVVFAQSLALLVSVCGIATTQMRLFWTQVPLQLAVLLSVIVSSKLLIPADPVAGGVWTYVVRIVTQLALYVVCVIYGVRQGRKLLLSRDKMPDMAQKTNAAPPAAENPKPNA